MVLCWWLRVDVELLEPHKLLEEEGTQCRLQAADLEECTVL